jgi:hypothetical protein
MRASFRGSEALPEPEEIVTDWRESVKSYSRPRRRDCSASLATFVATPIGR